MPSRSLTVGVTQADLAQALNSRKSLTIFNLHATAIAYFKEGSEVSANNGIPIYPGGNAGLTERDDGDYVKERFVIISDTANTNLIIVEGLKK